MSERRSTFHARRRHAAAAATAAAGIVHVAAAGPHLSQGWLLAAGFLAMGLLQLTLGLGLAVRRGGRFVGLGAGGVHVTALSVWALSRTVGLPPFLHSGVEPVGVADAMAASMELTAVVLLAWRATRPAPMGRSGAASVTAFTLAWVLAITGTAAGLGDLADTEHVHEAGEHEPADHHDTAHDDTGNAQHHHTGESEAATPRPEPEPSHDVIEDREAAPTSPATPEEHIHAPGEEH